MFTLFNAAWQAYRSQNQFKSHLKKSEGASHFSRTKTISQQRRSLPVFTVRDELLQVRLPS
jgi:pre-mRNA-splicing factor ATP-dependent RNA helicase DHX38/PRP16